MMIEDSISPLFINKDYILNIIDNFYANTMSYSKQQSSTERFLYFIGRHNAEFNIPIGTQTVQVRNRIGLQRDDIIIHEDDNLIDLSIDTDTGSFCTAIKGYYAFQSSGGEESTEKEPTKTYDYISPMASKYGVYWGEPIYDERYSSLEGIKEACKIKQESTFKMSFTLKASLFDIALNEGDEIRLVYPSKSINMYIRVVEISEDFDEDGDLIDAQYTFGNENISAQYRKMQYDAIADLGDILMGKKPIPFSVLPSAVRQATQVINDGENTQFYYRENEIYGVNLDNPLGVTRYNANGLGFSQDGGKTYSNAITYLGVVTESLTAGTIDANRITIYGSEGYNQIQINGDRLKVWDSRDPEVYTEISRGRIHANKGALSVTRDDAYTDFEGKKYGEYMQDGKPNMDVDVQRNQFMHSGVVNFTGQNYQMRGNNMTDGTTYNCETIYTSHKSKYITMGFGMNLSGATSRYIIVELREFGSGSKVATHREFVTESGGTHWANVRINLGVPDYDSGKSFYVSAGMENPLDDAYLHVRVNRVSMHG